MATDTRKLLWQKLDLGIFWPEIPKTHIAPYVCNTIMPYCIAGNFRWCKFSHIWLKSPQNKFLYILISHARATRPRPCMAYSTARRYRSRFLASVLITRLVKSLWVGCSRIWHSIAVYHESRSSLRVVLSTCKNLDGSNFIFACRMHMRNMWKLAPSENFPLYGIHSDMCIQLCHIQSHVFTCKDI